MTRPTAEEFVAELRALVEVESPSSSPDAVRHAAAATVDLLHRRTGRHAQILERGGTPHVWLPADDRPDVLLLGHIDTVWPLGTLARWPLDVEAGDDPESSTVSGPGVFDMKAGIVMGAIALQQVDPDGRVAMLLTGDEEIGALTSLPLIQEVARTARAVLVLEPAGPGGAVKKARKGHATLELVVHGRAAHAGLEPENGVNALTILALLIPQVVGLADAPAGTTVTPTLATAGTTMNTVPAAARCTVDVRAETEAELARVVDGLAALGTDVPGAHVELVRHTTRPPLEVGASADLLAVHAEVTRQLGHDLPPAMSVGGVSDGNFTAAIGVPTLDGLGAVGGGAHAEGEHLVLGPTLDATERLAGLLRALLDS